MKRFSLAAGLAVLFFFACCGTGYTLSVTLVESPSAHIKGDTGSAKQPIILSFGSKRVVIHGSTLRVPGKVLTRNISLSKLFLIRDYRALSQRSEYETIYRYGPFQLAIVPKPGLLAGVKHVGMHPITGSMVVTKEAKVRKAKASATVTQVLDKLDRTRYGKYMTLLAGDSDMPTRYACSSDAQAAHDAIVKAFQDIGMDSLVTDQKFQISSEDCEWDCTEKQGSNVIAIKKGATRPDEYYVVGAHYDSANDKTSPCKLAPGANDNASGVAGVLELAKIFKGFTTDASIVFAAFGGEEIDLLGSRKYVQDLVDNGDGGAIKAFVVLDMISYYGSQQKIYVEGSNKTTTQKAAVDNIVKDTSTYTGLKCEYSYDFESDDKGNSDHVPFLSAGMPGALIIQWDSDAKDYKYLHTAQDEMKYQKLPFAIEILKVAAATLTQAGVETSK